MPPDTPLAKDAAAIGTLQLQIVEQRYRLESILFKALFGTGLGTVLVGLAALAGCRGQGAGGPLGMS